MAAMLGKLKIELQPPCMATSSKDSGIDSTTTCEGGIINLDVHLLMFG